MYVEDDWLLYDSPYIGHTSLDEFLTQAKNDEKRLYTEYSKESSPKLVYSEHHFIRILQAAIEIIEVGAGTTEPIAQVKSTLLE